MVRHTIQQDNDEVIPSEVERTLLLLLGIVSIIFWFTGRSLRVFSVPFG